MEMSSAALTAIFFLDKESISFSISLFIFLYLANTLPLLHAVPLTGVLRDVTTHFIVDARSQIKTGGNHVKVRIINPSGSNTDAYLTDKGDGTYRVEYTAYEEGEQKKK